MEFQMLSKNAATNKTKTKARKTSLIRAFSLKSNKKNLSR